jgi:hypothetical protein
MMRSALIALVAVSAVASTSVAPVPSKNTNVNLSLVTDQPVPLKIEKQKRNFALSMNSKSAFPISVSRAQAKVKLGKSNTQIAREAAREAKLASKRKTGYTDPMPVYGEIPSDAAYRKWLKAAASKYGVSNQTYQLYRVMMGESGGNPYAHNASGASGLFQFIPSTWRSTPYGGCSIWDAKSQCYAAAWMFSQGRQREWVVYNMYF